MKPIKLVPEPLRALQKVWFRRVRSPRLRAAAVASLLVVVVAMLVARRGTGGARVAAASMIGVAALVLVGLRVAERRVLRDPARTLRLVAGDVDAEVTSRAVRALSLLDPEATRGASRVLAELHVERALAAIPIEGVRRGGARVGAALGIAALVLGAATIAACAASPWAPFEGADVLVARGGVAPVGMAWLTELSVRARPPDYLHAEERRVAPYDVADLPRGTLLTFRGTPLHAGRKLLLSDGSAEVPFVEDGSGNVVARWPLEATADLRVVARFGEIVIPEPQRLTIESIPDQPPHVVLGGAPKRILLDQDDYTPEIPLHYEAVDDHGLREVHLVLRAGAREERRVLARLDGETKVDRGGHSFRVTDPFVRKNHAPIEIRVEAKDNDPITGPKWGASEAITLVPPDVGEPEARRLQGLRALRDRLTDSLASRMTTPLPAAPKERRVYLEAQKDRLLEDDAALETALTSSFAGARFPSRLGAMLRGQMRKLREAVSNESRSPSTTARSNVIKANERVVLVVDAVMQGQGIRDARSVARELADVADELASAAATGVNPTEKTRAVARMDAAVMVLAGGGRSMLRLGALGRDLGEIVGAVLARVGRAREADDLSHTTLAAQDLAARLRQPDPSFGSRGGRPSHAGGESGGGRGAPGADADAEASDVEKAFNEAAQDLERLAAEHAGNVGKVEQSLAGGSSAEDAKQLAEEAKRHAQKVREAARGLPSVGAGSDSWTSKGAAAREHAEQMAKALEQGHAADAVQSGRSAMGALDEAKRATRDRWGRFGDPDRAIDEAKRGLDHELKWAEEKLEELRRRAAQRAAPELRDHGESENKLAERARELARKGRDQDALPPAALDALEDAEAAAREAARALREGNAERGLDRQRDAQQKLEMAKDALGDGEAPRGNNGGDEGMSQEHTDIPKADQHKGPEEFRKRVMKGLAQPSTGKLKDALRRYAEGLLR